MVFPFVQLGVCVCVCVCLLVFVCSEVSGSATKTTTTTQWARRREAPPRCQSNGAKSERKTATTTTTFNRPNNKSSFPSTPSRRETRGKVEKSVSQSVASDNRAYNNINVLQLMPPRRFSAHFRVTSLVDTMEAQQGELLLLLLCFC